MVNYLLKRGLYMIVSLALMTIVAFILINLPPDNYVELYIQQLETSGTTVDESMVLSLKRQYGFGDPFHIRYFKWVKGMFRGNFRRSFVWGRPVLDLIISRLPYTLIIAGGTLLFTYIVAIPIGIYSVTHRYSILVILTEEIKTMIIGILGPIILLVPIFRLCGVKY